MRAGMTLGSEIIFNLWSSFLNSLFEILWCWNSGRSSGDSCLGWGSYSLLGIAKHMWGCAISGFLVGFLVGMIVVLYVLQHTPSSQRANGALLSKKEGGGNAMRVVGVEGNRLVDIMVVARMKSTGRAGGEVAFSLVEFDGVFDKKHASEI